MRIIAWVLLLLCGLLLVSLFACNPCKRAMKRGCYTRDTLAITDSFMVRDTIVLPGDTVAVAFNPDSLEVDRLTELLNDAQFMITAYRNQKGQVELRVIEKEKKVPFEKLVYRTIKVPVLKATPPPTRWQKVKCVLESFFLAAGIIAIVLLCLGLLRIGK